MKQPPEGTLQIPWGAQAPPPPTTNCPEKGGRNLRGPTEGRPKASDMGCVEKRVNLGGHMEIC